MAFVRIVSRWTIIPSYVLENLTPINQQLTTVMPVISQSKRRKKKVARSILPVNSAPCSVSGLQKTSGKPLTSLSQMELPFEFIIERPPKLSLNDWYSGSKHWSQRVKLKNEYRLLIMSVCPFPLKGKFYVTYNFEFSKRPLDADNCVAMVKLINDGLLASDKYNELLGVCMTSRRGDKDLVKITVEPGAN